MNFENCTRILDPVLTRILKGLSAAFRIGWVYGIHGALTIFSPSQRRATLKIQLLPPSFPSAMPMTYVTTPSNAPIHVISKPLAHQDRMVMRDFAAPTAK